MELGAGTGDELLLDIMDNAVEVQPTMRFKAHQDTVTSVSFQPWRAEMLTASGSRHFDLVDEGDSGSEDNERFTIRSMDNSVAIWDLTSTE